MSRSRINVYLERDHDKRLQDLCTLRGLSKSAVVAAALASFFSPDGADRREAAIARRLDKLTNQFDRLSRDQTILIETMGLFIRYQLSITSPLPEAHQEAARAQGKVRFQQFIEQLARHLQREGVSSRTSPRRSRPPRKNFIANLPAKNAPSGGLMIEETLTPRKAVTERQIQMLRTAMGPDIASALDDPEVVEVLLNPDGSLWVDRLGTGRAATGINLAPATAERVIRLVASCIGVEVHARAPIVSAELFEGGERFEGVLPPIVRAPTFAIRKRAIGVIRLERYVSEQILTGSASRFLAPGGVGTPQYPHRRWYLDRQDDACQCALAGSRNHQRPRHRARGHGRASMHCGGSRTASDQARRRFDGGTGALHLAPPARSYRRR